MSCSHLDNLGPIKEAKAYECEECVKTGSRWVHLRTCQTCGVTLCCDSSPNTHMTKHYYTLDHPMATSAEPGEDWAWCYKDQQILRL
ncbi:MAG: hypothetical protein ACI83W_001911 [Marinoscillum sp.]|jgi:hypothetical protein